MSYTTLTNADLAKLKTDIFAQTDPAFVAARNVGNDDVMAAFYNAIASPTYIVWRTSVSKTEIQTDPAFDWTRVDNLSVGKARIWDYMFYTDSINPSYANVRTGIDSVWVGTQADLNVRASVYTHCKRPATVGEKLFSSGAGTDASPSAMTFEGAITPQNVSDARNLP